MCCVEGDYLLLWTMKRPKPRGLRGQPILHGTKLEAKIDAQPFFARVPTYSNFGDDPSRGQFSKLERCGATRTPISDALIAKLCKSDSTDVSPD